MIRTHNSNIIFSGDTGSSCLNASATLHNLIEKQGYQDITLDFSQSQFLDPRFMIPLVTIVRSYRHKKIDFDIVLPEEDKSEKLFRNTNWAHLILPERFDSNDRKNINHVSAIRYASAEEQFDAVDRSLKVLLQSISGLDREHIKALEWALNEITDNVLNHAESPIGGIVQVVTFPNKKLIEFYVCDAGISIPKSLRQGRKDIIDDESAVQAAIEEGVTRNPKTNQGNGLYGTFRCCKVSGGEFDVLSGMIGLHYSKDGLRVWRNDVPFNGTFIRASINYDFEKLLEEALIFKGKRHDPGGDYIERLYEVEDGQISFLVSRELNAFGTREAGKLARTKIENLMNKKRTKIMFDFDNIHLISSSFADGVFGKLFLDLGPVKFGQLCDFRNLDPTVGELIDRAIAQRMKE